MNIRYVIALLVALLSGCGGGAQSPQQQFRISSTTSAPWITKGAIFGQYGETTPIVWNNDLLYVSTAVDSAGRHTVITRESDRSIVADVRDGLGFVSAIVSNGTLYIFGTNSDSSGIMPGGSTISMVSTIDLINWTQPQVVFVSPIPATVGTGIFNNSVTADSTGYTMTYEVCESGTVCFNAKFLHSTDLINWTPIGGRYEWGFYTACPTIRYVNGHYYLFYLSAEPIAGNQFAYLTNVSRSTDLNTWDASAITVLSPLDDAPSNNTSDMDLVEFNGQVRMVYENSSQIGQTVPNTGLREATYNGTLAQFVGLFF